MTNQFLTTISTRHCKRKFLPKEVSKELLEQIFEAAKNAPSSKNTQCWQAAVLSGGSRDELSHKLCENFDNEITEGAEYHNHKGDMPEKYMNRARACGYGLFELKGIERKDYEARKLHNRENFTFFDAPVEMIFHLDKGCEHGAFLDMGFFMQNVMLGLRALGLDSCPQYSVACYPKTIKEHLGLADDRLIVAGLAVGYADPDAKVNGYIPDRLNLEEFVSWHK